MTNLLMLPVEISFTDQDGSPYVGQTVTVAKSSVAANRLAFLSTDSVKMSWSVNREQIGTSGYYYGASIGSTFTTPRDPSADLAYTVDNIYGGKTYYYPQLSNPTNDEAAPYIDYDIAGEINVCWIGGIFKCSVAPGAVEMGLGYYELKTTSRIGYKYMPTLYSVGIGYYWSYANFIDKVQSGSGATSLTISW